jgi:hypothetical protein
MKRAVRSRARFGVVKSCEAAGLRREQAAAPGHTGFVRAAGQRKEDDVGMLATCRRPA